MYENLLILDRGVSVLATIANTQELSDNEDISITSIPAVTSTIQVVKNANNQSVNTGTDTARKKTEILRAEVQAHRQAMANNALWMQHPAD